MDRYYIYCIAKDAPEGIFPGLAGIGGKTVVGVRHNSLTAFVSTTDLTHIEVNFENLRAHENVIDRLMEEYELLPMSFSTICSSFDGIGEILVKYCRQFRENLTHVSGRVEMGLKVFCKLEPESGEPEVPPAPSSSPKDYMMRLYGSYLSRKKRTDELFAEIDGFHGELMGIAEDCRYTKPMKNSLVFNASYLVEKNRREEFERAVAEITGRYPTYKIVCSGPWPAYHFIKFAREENEDGQHQGREQQQ